MVVLGSGGLGPSNAATPKDPNSFHEAISGIQSMQCKTGVMMNYPPRLHALFLFGKSRKIIYTLYILYNIKFAWFHYHSLKMGNGRVYLHFFVGSTFQGVGRNVVYCCHHVRCPCLKPGMFIKISTSTATPPFSSKYPLLVVFFGARHFHKSK